MPIGSLHLLPTRLRVVITGIGAVSPNGVGAEAFADGCLEGRSGVSPLRLPDLTGLRSSVAAQALDFDAASVMDPAELRRVPRMIPMALAASQEALAQARVELAPDDYDAQRQIGVAL